MKFTLALLAAAATVSAAQPHHHQHQHLHDKREAVPDPVADFITVPGPTEVVYVLNGEPIGEEDVQRGIANGTLVWAANGQISKGSSAAPSTSAPPAYTPPASSSVYVPPPVTSSSSTSEYVAPTPQSSSQEAPSSHSAPSAVANYVHPSASSSASSSAAPSAAPQPSSTPSSTPSSSSTSSSFDHNSASGVNEEFPDGQLDCSTFPSQYGALAVDYMNLGGWIGVQSPGSHLGGFSNIMTVVKGQCTGSDCCGEGMFCSYACPAGYQKSQWPSTQGATGQSVGGLLCQNGKLHLTNPSLSKNICMSGTDKVTVLVKNTLSDNVAVCRTDYPGTESETVPLDAQPGSTTNLTCPDGDNYYKWNSASTSAQYYVNPAGVSVQNACQWGSSANPWGNYAPMNLGVGYSNGAAWLSIFQNAPTTDAKLQFSVEIQGDNMSGKCKYSNGQYCGGADGNSCSPTVGCTVSVSSGTAMFIFS